MYFGNLAKHSIPIATVSCCLVSIALFIGINIDGDFSWDGYSKWGSPPFYEIYTGAYWGLITSSFLHVELWHIVSNIFWMLWLGIRIEPNSTKLHYIIFILIAAIISALAELAFSHSNGIGLSGIVYAIFGFILIKSKNDKDPKFFISNFVTWLFFLNLVLGFVFTKTKILIVANAAHVGGLFWGVLVALISKQSKSLQLGVGLAICALLVTLAIAGLFSTTYLQSKAYNLHEIGKLDEATSAYETILVKEPNNEFAKENLKIIEVAKLQEEAFKLHNDKQYEEARLIYNKILEIDMDNKWAQENLKLLP